MEIVFIDPEPPSAAGGGIRTYLTLALTLCREAGMEARVYTHNPDAYPPGAGFPIGRKAWLRPPIRGLAYRLLYQENVLWEHACWLNAELQAGDRPDRVYEFADYLGYGFFALRNRALRDRTILRVHTPDFLARSAPAAGTKEGWARVLSAWREKDGLRRARRITAPSAQFMRENLPWMAGWEYVPNPLPPRPPVAARVDTSERGTLRPAEGGISRPTRSEPQRFLYLGRVEERKGVLVLVRAFMRLAAENPQSSLTLVGSAVPGPYSEGVRALIESLPGPLRQRIDWQAPCLPEARADLFLRHHALVTPSLFENSPYVYFEGMAAGLACIGSATGEMKAVAAITGALSPRPGDEESWLEALRAHCAGASEQALGKQAAYLSDRRAGIAAQSIAAWRKAAGAA
ncbi:MAG: glycosyltransferase family 4 protein [Fibrobacteria bacterium]